ncbi:DegV family protein [Nocardioides marmoriginsengisoli]|uniref:DegV family protein n=1 Tax=Nocardioides marmoriginsengisoli TaxID=661483 RepID=A0A3N0CJX6_9ACTN|nr:DegV family protein [Nocardioides marmoriginsengisoli]RNL63742.1 DegV family protein [Nocardioides marmoriginsengisoli]
MPIALVTDSTASLTPEVAAARCVTVVPLQVVIGAESYDEGTEDGVTPELLAEALREWTPVSTSRPNPDEMLEVYERLVAEGATEIVSIHLSADLSGTFESAQLAARQCSVPVRAVDSRQVGMGTGFAVLAAAEIRDAGGTAEEMAAAARDRSAGTTSLFYVDTLEYLRRGGRMGAAAALVGSALAVKPILKVESGRIGPFERVRTSSKALSRLEELAVEAAGDLEVDVAVAHLASPDRAATLATKLAVRLAEGLAGREVGVGEIGAVLGAHVGPGMVAVCVAPRAVHNPADGA